MKTPVLGSLFNKVAGLFYRAPPETECCFKNPKFARETSTAEA